MFYPWFRLTMVVIEFRVGRPRPQIYALKGHGEDENVVPHGMDPVRDVVQVPPSVSERKGGRT